MRKTASGTMKLFLIGLLVGTALAFQPAFIADAQGAGDPTPPPSGARRDDRLERAWLRQQRVLNRLGFMFDHAQQRIQHAQELIERAGAEGKDVSAIQTSLDAFADALQAARPSYEGAKGLVQSHKGFDADGNVVDSDAAGETVEAMSQRLKAVRDTLLQPGRDLRDAFRQFREENRPSAP